MKRTFFIPVIIALLTSSCASKWTLDAESPRQPLQWTDASGRPLLKHVAILNGFRENGSSPGSIVRSIIFGRARDSGFMQPVAVAVGPDGRLAVADAGCACVHLYVPGESRYQRILGSTAERLRSPVSVVFDDASRLYVSDSAAGAVFVFNDQGKAVHMLREAGSTPLHRPTGLAYARGPGVLYVADTAAHVIYAFNNLSLLFTLGGRGVEQGRFNFPTHLHAGDNGAVHVTDSMNFRIQSFDGSGRILSSFGRHGDGSGDFSMPKGIAADREGVLYVVDTLFDNVQLFNEKGEFLLTVGRRGGSAGEFWLPSGIFLDGQDKLYVCDTYNQRIQVFQIMRERHE
jgi:DNA-binding beta-propeller fold protein YncE